MVINTKLRKFTI